MIGIFGGTFDPVHYGHLEPAGDIKRELGLSKLLFIPNNIPPHRQQPQLSTAQRISLLQLALAEYDGFEMDLREIERAGKSYMVDTLASLSEDYGGETLCLIIGMDALAKLTGWHRWQKLFDYCHLVVTARPAFELPATLHPDLQARRVDSAEALQRHPRGKILIKSVAQLNISASDIRQRVASGEDASELMPAAVYSKYREMINLHAN
jgi:nicotinate-nucleotide adenylyltransferase